MPETLVIQFKAKRSNYFDGPGYSIPQLKAHHVVTPVPQRGMRARLWAETRDADLMKRRAVAAYKAVGLDGYVVYEADAARLDAVTVEPQGNGFMALVSIEVQV